MRKIGNLILAGICVAGTALGGQATWTNRLGGALNDAVNWTNEVPGVDAVLRMYNGGVPNGTTLNVWLTDHLTSQSWDGGYGSYFYNMDLRGYDLTLITTTNDGWRTTVSNQNSTNVLYNTSGTVSTVTANRLYVGGGTGSRTLLDIVGTNVIFQTTGSGDRIINGAATTGLSGDANGIVRVRDGALWTNGAGNILVGNTSGRHGSIVVQGEGSRLHIEAGRILDIGGHVANTSIGTLQVTQGGAVSGGLLYIGREVGNLGYGIFDGAGSSYTNGAFGDASAWVYIGAKGTGIVTVANQAVVGTREHAWIGNGHLNTAVMNADAYGELTVSTSGQFHARDALVGQLATGKVLVQSGGKFYASGPGGLLLGEGVFSTTNNSAAQGTFTVSNLNSAATVRNLTIGGVGTGLLEVMDKATLSVNGTDTNGYIHLNRGRVTISDATLTAQSMNAASGTTVRVELGVRDNPHMPENAYLHLTDTLTLDSNVTLEIGLLDSFTGAGYATDGSQYISLVSFDGGLTGSFANYAPNDEFTVGAYTFRYLVETDSDVYLQIIPEPGTLGLVGAGLGLAALLRRRARRS